MELQPIDRSSNSTMSEHSFTDEEVASGIPQLVSICQECHVGGGENNLPALKDIMGYPIAGKQFKGYSESLLQHRCNNWERDNLNEFLQEPEMFAKGTPMSDYAIKDEEIRQRFIDYLSRLQK